MMRAKQPVRDPIKADMRKAIAVRRVGEHAICTCGESRPEALIAGSKPITCAECRRKSRGQTAIDAHHFAGKANSPVTVPIPANDHRAILSVNQYDWPKRTLENPDCSPLLAASACIRGFIDWIFYVVKNGLLWIAEMLEGLDDFLANKYGPNWWFNTPLARFSPKG